MPGAIPGKSLGPVWSRAHEARGSPTPRQPRRTGFGAGRVSPIKHEAPPNKGIAQTSGTHELSDQLVDMFGFHQFPQLIEGGVNDGLWGNPARVIHLGELRRRAAPGFVALSMELPASAPGSGHPCGPTVRPVIPPIRAVSGAGRADAFDRGPTELADAGFLQKAAPKVTSRGFRYEKTCEEREVGARPLKEEGRASA